MSCKSNKQKKQRPRQDGKKKIAPKQQYMHGVPAVSKMSPLIIQICVYVSTPSKHFSFKK